MAKLTVNARKEIIKELMKPYDKAEEKLLKKLSRCADELFLLQTPRKIIEVELIFPKFFAQTRKYQIYLSNYRKSWNIPDNCYGILHLKKYIPYFHQQFLIGMSDNYPEFGKLLKSYISLFKANVVIRNKLTCVLEHITTEKRLYDEFPEAYQAYSSIGYVPEKRDENLCDSIENVRVLLSKDIKNK